MHISPIRQRFAVGYVLKVLAAVLIATAGTAFAQSSPRVVTFGDSFSDSGNAFDFVKSNATPPGYGMGITLIPEAPYARNGHHLTNGPTWAELLADAAGAPQNAQPAFRSSNPRAMNFAIATARARGAAGDPGPNLAMEVAAFLVKTGGIAPADALYIVEFGANDVGDALDAPNPVAALAILNNAVAAMVDAIVTLRNAGAKTFLITNVANAGLSPAVRILDVLQPGTAAAAATVTTIFNGLLAAALAPLPPALGITIVPFDGHALFQDLVANPGAAGLENVTDACLTPDTAPFVCRTPDRYLYWDGVHPTAAVHALVAGAVAALLGF